MAKKVYALPNLTTPGAPVIQDPEKCTGCNHCVEICQVDVFLPNPVKGKTPIILHPDECWYCGCCATDCPAAAITFNWPIQQRAYWRDKATGKVLRDSQ